MKNTITLGVLTIIFALVVLPTRAHAVINLIETTDFSGNLSSPFIVPESLGFGTNTITGFLPKNSDFGFEENDVDVFHVNNPDELTVSSITVEISNFVGTTTEPNNGAGALRLEDPGFDQEIVFGNGQFTIVASPANASVFEFRFIGPGDIMNDEAGSMDYVVTINAIPEPAVIGFLFGVIAFGVCLCRRRVGIGL